jgi:hypothetical protein
VNRLQPGIFSEQVRSITCLPWRTRQETPPLAWSGLKPGDDDIPVFYVSETARTALEVRWRTEPRDVKPGSVEYQVAVITGSEEVLAIEHVSHSARDVQKCKFVAEHFAELDRDGKWEAIVRVTPVGDELQGITARTEEFIVVFGEATSETRSTVGRKVRSLVDEVIRFENEDEYTRSCAMPLVETKGHISVRVVGKSARVFRPAIVRAAEESWRTNDFKVGRWIVRVRDDGSVESAPVFHALEGEGVEQDVWKRVEDATRALATRAAARQGFIGMVYRDMDLADKYVTAGALRSKRAIPSSRSPTPLRCRRSLVDGLASSSFRRTRSASRGTKRSMNWHSMRGTESFSRHRRSCRRSLHSTEATFPRSSPAWAERRGSCSATRWAFTASE